MWLSLTPPPPPTHMKAVAAHANYAAVQFVADKLLPRLTEKTHKYVTVWNDSHTDCMSSRIQKSTEEIAFWSLHEICSSWREDTSRHVYNNRKGREKLQWVYKYIYIYVFIYIFIFIYIYICAVDHFLYQSFQVYISFQINNNDNLLK